MKCETEIRQKLECYERMMAGMEAGQAIGNPDIFLTISRHFPGEVMELLGSESRAELLIQRMPPEDRPWVRQWFSFPGRICPAGTGNQDRYPRMGSRE